MRINPKTGCVERRVTARKGHNDHRDWWIVKAHQTKGYIPLSNSTLLLIPKELIGKKVRLKIEILT